MRLEPFMSMLQSCVSVYVTWFRHFASHLALTVLFGSRFLARRVSIAFHTTNVRVLLVGILCRRHFFTSPTNTVPVSPSVGQYSLKS